MKYFILPYKQGSKSAKLLARALDGKVLKLKNSKYKPKPHHKIIKWGEVGNKLVALTKLKEAGVSVPPFTTSRITAQAFVDAGAVVFARKLLGSHSGNGIVVVEGGIVPDAPLYTQYIKKRDEYRVHVFGGKVIHVQEKRRKNGVPANMVRSHGNGYVFAINDVAPPPQVLTEAIQAVVAMGYDKGAVDVIYNAKQDKAYVLEVNSAPGLCETTANIYAEAIKNAAN